MKVTFDGLNKLIIINPMESIIDIRNDIYTEWVIWAESNTEFSYPIRYTGGEPTSGGQLSGIIFFMINGWKIYFEHSVTFNGSIFSDDFPTPFSTPPGTYMAQSISSSLVTQVPGTSLSSGDINTIKDSIWGADLSTYNSNVAGGKVDIIDIMNVLITELHKINGLDPNHYATVTKTSRVVDDITQTFNVDSDGDVTIIRN